MAALDNRRIVGDCGDQTAGGIFLLDHTLWGMDDASVSVGNGWNVEIRGCSQYVLARGPSLPSYEEAWTKALEMAQRGLDLFSIAGLEDFVIVNADEEHIAWWTEQTGVIVRVYMVEPLPTKYLFGVASSTSGIVWNESLRYFRLSQVTSDLFDAYRNIFLAIEAILSKKNTPLKGVRCRKQDGLRVRSQKFTLKAKSI